MPLDNIVIQEQPGELESLALALRAVGRDAGAELDYDDLCAALGVSFTACSTTREKRPGWWQTYGRDAFLIPAATLFGFELRDLHPPDVGIDMVFADEFPQHFELSYKPLILRALENGQPVLAWQGWEGFRWPFWGVITGAAGENFVGTTLWGNGQPVAHVNPAMQCYVVERCEPCAPPRDALRAMAMKHADGYMNRAVLAGGHGLAKGPPPLVTGPSAFDAWEAWLEHGEFGDPAVDDAWNDHRQNAEFITAARAGAERFLGKHRASFGDGSAEQVANAIEACADLRRALEVSGDERQVQEHFATRPGRQALLAMLHAAEAADRRLAARIEHLHSLVSR